MVWLTTIGVFAFLYGKTSLWTVPLLIAVCGAVAYAIYWLSANADNNGKARVHLGSRYGADFHPRPAD